MSIDWQVKTFDELSLSQLYAILKLRNEVFILEQKCYFPDIDNNDQHALHLFAINAQSTVAAYCRLLPPSLSHEQVSIGRVVTNPEMRKLELGKELVKRGIVESHRLFPGQTIAIGAQVYLLSFYESFGFIQLGESHLEDGIAHIKMILKSGL